MDPEVKMSSPNVEKNNLIKTEAIRPLDGLNSEERKNSVDISSEELNHKQEKLSESEAAISELPSSIPSAQLQSSASLVSDSGLSDDTTASAASLSADDSDLIEKGWVDRAKKIVNDTRDDPHMREDKVGKMQIEYINKRYGRKIGSAR